MSFLFYLIIMHTTTLSDRCSLYSIRLSCAQRARIATKTVAGTAFFRFRARGARETQGFARQRARIAAKTVAETAFFRFRVRGARETQGFSRQRARRATKNKASTWKHRAGRRKWRQHVKTPRRAAKNEASIRNTAQGNKKWYITPGISQMMSDNGKSKS